MAKMTTEFECICTRYRTLLSDGIETPKGCPHCHRRYRGELNKETGLVEAICLNPMIIEEAEKVVETGKGNYLQAKALIWDRDKELENG